jgi:hypothetical protein
MVSPFGLSVDCLNLDGQENQDKQDWVLSVVIQQSNSIDTFWHFMNQKDLKQL